MELRGFKRTEAGVIPEAWACSTVRGSASQARNAMVGGPFGSDLVSKDYVDNGVPVIRGQNMGAKAVSGSFVFVSQEKARSLEANIARPGDVVFTQRGTLGQVSLVPNGPFDRYLVSQSQMKVSLSEEAVDPEFFYYLFSGPAQQEAIRLNTIQTGVPHINLGILAAIPVPLPELAEQRAIAGALSDADALIESLEQLLAKKRHLKLGAMQELLTGKKRLPDFTDPWVPKRLGELTQMASGGTPPSTNSTFYGGDIPWVSISDMTRAGKTISQTERNLSDVGLAASAAKVLPAGTVLYAMYASLGECSIASVPMATSQAILGIRVGVQIDREFLYYTLASRKAAVERLGQQGTQSNLNKGIVQAFEVRLPSMAEQRDIATCLRDMDSEMAALEAKLTKARQIKQGMMQELLTGRIRLV